MTKEEEEDAIKNDLKTEKKETLESMNKMIKIGDGKATEGGLQKSIGKELTQQKQDHKVCRREEKTT